MAFRGRVFLYIGGYAKIVAGASALCGILGGVIVWGFSESDVRERIDLPVTVVPGINTSPVSIVRYNWAATDGGDRNIRSVERGESKNFFVRSVRGLIGKDWLPAKADYDALYAEARDDKWAEGVERDLNMFFGNYKFIQEENSQERKVYCTKKICGIMIVPKNKQDYFAAGILANNINDDRFAEYLDKMGMVLSSVTAGGADSSEAGVVVTIIKK